MNSERPRSEYRCSQGDLYTVGETIANTYGDHVTEFTNYSSLYTAATGTDLLLAIADARALPDESQRKAEHSVRRKQLDSQRVVCLSLWQQLTSYIRDGFAEDVYDDMISAAGQGYYDSALAGNWDSVRSLLDSAVTFIGNATTELTAGGMPATYPTALDTERALFATLHNEFLQSEEASRVATDKKVDSNNKVYREVMRICEDGKRIFRNNAAVREEFTFDRVLDLVSGSLSGHGVSGVTTDAATGAALGQVLLTLEELLADGTYVLRAELQSANDGSFKFNGVSNGTYRLTAQKAGFLKLEELLTVSDGPVVVDFGLTGDS